MTCTNPNCKCESCSCDPCKCPIKNGCSMRGLAKWAGIGVALFIAYKWYHSK